MGSIVFRLSRRSKVIIGGTSAAVAVAGGLSANYLRKRYDALNDDQLVSASTIKCDTRTFIESVRAKPLTITVLSHVSA